MAAPHVAGVAALFLEKNQDATPDEVAEKLLAESTKDSYQVSKAILQTSCCFLYSMKPVKIPNQKNQRSHNPKTQVPNPEDPETPNPENPLPEEPEEPELEPIVDTYKGIMKQWRFKKIARYKSGHGVHEGVFTGPENTDFDLYFLQREKKELENPRLFL